MPFYGQRRFQSSPALSGRCNLFPRDAGGSGSFGFNPHRPFRAGATSRDQLKPSRRTGFQSSPALSGRCNPDRPLHLGALGGLVSILTGPFGPVQPGNADPGERPGGDGFNPPRPFRAGATSRDQLKPSRRTGFQSSPALSGRCNPGTLTPENVRVAMVSILTGPFGPVQQLADASVTTAKLAFQSSPALSGRGNPGTLTPENVRVAMVSILTGPFGPVQRVEDGDGPVRDVVSILTGPFGPVQLPGRAGGP